MSVRLLTREDVEDAKNPGVKRKERFSFFGRTDFHGDVGRGQLYLTKSQKSRDGESPAGRPGGVTISAFQALSAADKNVFINATFEALITTLSKQRICVACAIQFTFARELGRRNCAWHPGKIAPGEVWSCCGKDWDPDQELKKRRHGCCLSDHNSRRNDPANRAVIVLPLLVAISFGIPMSSIPRRYWRDHPTPEDVCVIEITTTTRFGDGFVYADAPTKRELFERPEPYRIELVKRNALPIQALIDD